MLSRQILEWLESGKDVRAGDWNNEEIEVGSRAVRSELRPSQILNEMLLLTAKPTMYLLNLSDKDFIRKKNKWLAGIKKWIDEHGKDPVGGAEPWQLRLTPAADCADLGCI